MSDSAALDSFLEKWRARWPEWSVAEVFVAPARRDIVVAWFALLQEFEDVLNIAGDPLPADAKLAWWGEELRGWASQRSRHPLGRRLEPVRADWARLADAFEQLQTDLLLELAHLLVQRRLGDRVGCRPGRAGVAALCRHEVEAGESVEVDHEAQLIGR